MRHEPMRMRAIEARLAHALVANALADGVTVAVVGHDTRPWASATFEGALHTVTLNAPRAAALGDWAAALPDAELPMRGHVVASIAIDRIEDDGDAVTLTLTALTIEDR